ncbi:MAG: GIY-YIG nuclease family protein [Thermomicrobiales bacterium]
MNDRARRKELQAEYKRTRPDAGVYRIVNSKNNKVFLGSTTDVAGIGKKLAFARSTNMSGVLDLRLRDDIRAFGIEAFSLEVLEVLETEPAMTTEEIRRDLATLEELWREKLDPALLY